MLSRITQIAIGLSFIVAAYLKFSTIDVFELYIYSLDFFSFNFSSVLSRLLISVEAILGTFLVFNWYTKNTWKTTMAVLLSFSAFLIYLLFIGDDRNCNCFGDLLALTPSQSLIKNALLIALLFFVKNQAKSIFKYEKIAAIIMGLTLLILPPIISPPDFLVSSRYATKEINHKAIFDVKFPDFAAKNNNLAQGKKLVCFFLMKCKYCKLATQKLNILIEKIGIDKDVFFVFTGKEEGLDHFWEKTESKTFEHTILPANDFFELSGKRLPAIMLVEDGQLIQHYGYRDMDEQTIIDFFKK